MAEYKCETCGERLEPFDDEGMLVIPPCQCVKRDESIEITEPVVPEKGEE
jgi:DNA-directed RNA polymerase subunit RPC12/RpoP